MTLFVTLGFERRPFNRLLRAVDDGIEGGRLPVSVFVQRGHSTFVPRHCTSQRFLEYDVMVEYLREADIVVAHAGVGTMLLCSSLGKVPILFPRQASLGEHVDDHQVDFARTMWEQKRAFMAATAEELYEIIRCYRDLVGGIDPHPREDAGRRLSAFLGNILAETTS